MSKRIPTTPKPAEVTRLLFIAPFLWILSLQYFVVQAVAAQAWKEPFSLAINPISDLGNTVCGVFAERFVCSPYHLLMNVSFIVLGITMTAGAALLYQQIRKAALGLGCLAIAGIGTILVGVFPENGSLALHAFGAALPFLFGNIGLLLVARSLAMPRWLRYYTFISGAIALVALILFVTRTFLGLGEGGMERIVAYPQTVWLIIYGAYRARRIINTKMR